MQSPKKIKTVFSNFDAKVFIVLAVTLIIGITYLLFQKEGFIDCENADFIVESKEFAVGELITFSNRTENAQSWKWDFGDNSEQQSRPYAMHKFEKPGKYQVRLLINGVCSVEKTIEVLYNNAILVNPASIPKIIVEDFVNVGEPVDFNFSYEGKIYSIEWSFGQSNKLDDTKKAPYYIYTAPGPKRVSLIINGDIKTMATKQLFVQPKIEPEEEEVEEITLYNPEKEVEEFEYPLGDPEMDPMEEFIENIPAKPVTTIAIAVDDSVNVKLERAETISKEQFELLLLEVANQAKTKDDFLDYLCQNPKVPVINNGRIYKFVDFCEKIKGKTIKIESLLLLKDNIDCIDKIEVEYKVKRKIGWWKEK